MKTFMTFFLGCISLVWSQSIDNIGLRGKEKEKYYKRVIGSETFYYPAKVTNGKDTSRVVVLDHNFTYCFSWNSAKFKKMVLKSILADAPLFIKNQKDYEDLMLCKIEINGCLESIATNNPDFFKQFEFDKNPEKIVKSTCKSTGNSSENHNGFLFVMIKLGYYCEEHHDYDDFYSSYVKYVKRYK